MEKLLLMDGKIILILILYDATNEFVKYGFTEFLTTNVSKDGTLEGPDIESLKKNLSNRKL